MPVAVNLITSYSFLPPSSNTAPEPSIHASDCTKVIVGLLGFGSGCGGCSGSGSGVTWPVLPLWLCPSTAKYFEGLVLLKYSYGTASKKPILLEYSTWATTWLFLVVAFT